MKKRERAGRLTEQNQGVFKCPVCGETMFMKESHSLVCKDGHSFDLSKKGYLNLLRGGYTPVYTKELFEARHQVCQAGFYNPLINKLAEIIDYYKAETGSIGARVLDAGCGEGSHLYGVSQATSGTGEAADTEKAAGQGQDTYVGVDISKDSIQIAATNHDDLIWCVADLARLPFQNNSFDVVLNVLSPANYGEFQRILKDEGLVVKAIPGSDYLIELREIVHKEGEVAYYSNQKVADYFQEKLVLKDIQQIHYKFAVSKELLPHFVKMTPLTWGKEAESLENVYGKNVTEITVDLTILIGTRKK